MICDAQLCFNAPWQDDHLHKYRNGISSLTTQLKFDLARKNMDFLGLSLVKTTAPTKLYL